MRDVVAAAIGDATLRILRHDPPARLGEAEGIHQLRVATRRLRSDLRTLAPYVERRWADRIRARLSEIAGRLGAVRDIDVQRARLAADAGELHDDLGPLWSGLEARHADALAEVRHALADPTYVELLDELVGAAGDPPVTASAGTPSADAASALALAAWRRLERRADALRGTEPDAALHAVRIRAKRARYAAECVARGLSTKRGAQARRMADRLADLQALLGGIQDGAVAVELLTGAVAERPRATRFALAAGRLIERELARGLAARAAYPALWSDLRRPRWRRWAVT